MRKAYGVDPDERHVYGPSTRGKAVGRGFAGMVGDPPEPAEMPPGYYTGAPVFREGGVRAGGVSERDTLPSASTHVKRGFDEHDRPNTAATVHGVPGVEGIPQSLGGDSDGDDDGSSAKEHGMGHKCQSHGCGYEAKTTHGLARHTHARHGFGRHGLGGVLANGARAGDGKGESDSTKTMSTITPAKTAGMRSGPSVGSDCCSSYDKGDGGGSYGRR